jgi:hypothetical protein
MPQVHLELIVSMVSIHDAELIEATRLPLSQQIREQTSF